MDIDLHIKEICKNTQWGKQVLVSHSFCRLFHLKRCERSAMFIIDTLQLSETECKQKECRKSHSMISKVFVYIYNGEETIYLATTNK